MSETKTRTVKATVVEKLSEKWKPGCIRVPDLDALERWYDREERYEMFEMRGGGGFRSGMPSRMERRMERDETCYYDVYSARATCEMRLKARYAVNGQTYEREVTFTSDSDSVPKTVLLKCDRKEPGNVLETSADHSDDWFWFWVAMAAMSVVCAIMLTPFILLSKGFLVAGGVTLGVIALTILSLYLYCKRL